MVAVGFTLHPDDEFLALTERVAARADYLEITPETVWVAERDGTLRPNGFWRRFRDAARAWDKPLVAHSVGMSMGSPHDARRARWLARMREDHGELRYLWWTDHAGVTTLAGEHSTHPMPLPLTRDSARAMRATLDEMAEVVRDVGVENSVVHFTLGDPRDEPLLLRETVGERHWLLLDLHNVHTMSVNLGLDARAWIDALDLSRVIELHVSGGSESDPRWLPSGRTLRLDGHDTPVPPEVWALLDYALPRCANVRGVTLERMEGTVRDRAEARALIGELERARDAIARSREARAAEVAAPGGSARALEGAAPLEWERVVAASMRAADPTALLPDADADGLRMHALLVARLRFERLVQGSPAAADELEREPAAFAQRFRRYHEDVAPTEHFADGEARLWAAWRERA